VTIHRPGLDEMVGLAEVKSQIKPSVACVRTDPGSGSGFEGADSLRLRIAGVAASAAYDMSKAASA
jgi:hypothetical protein